MKHLTMRKCSNRWKQCSIKKSSISIKTIYILQHMKNKPNQQLSKATCMVFIEVALSTKTCPQPQGPKINAAKGKILHYMQFILGYTSQLLAWSITRYAIQAAFPLTRHSSFRSIIPELQQPNDYWFQKMDIKTAQPKKLLQHKNMYWFNKLQYSCPCIKWHNWPSPCQRKTRKHESWTWGKPYDQFSKVRSINSTSILWW